jgi:DNA-binding Xre family transcriptional regulator
MLILNLRKAIIDKGFENPSLFLRQCGLAPYTASKLLQNNVDSINFKKLEQICLLLKCTIDDLFVWIPDDNSSGLDNHPLQKLKPKADKENINQIIRQLPFDKLDAVKEFLEKLNTDNPQQA